MCQDRRARIAGNRGAVSHDLCQVSPWTFGVPLDSYKRGRCFLSIATEQPRHPGVTVLSRPSLDALRGSLDLLVLKTLSLSPMHGWGISQRVQQIPTVCWRSTRVRSIPRCSGSRSPADRQRLGHHRQQPAGALYRLTAAGRRALGPSSRAGGALPQGSNRPANHVSWRSDEAAAPRGSRSGAFHDVVPLPPARACAFSRRLAPPSPGSTRRDRVPHRDGNRERLMREQGLAAR